MHIEPAWVSCGLAKPIHLKSWKEPVKAMTKDLFLKYFSIILKQEAAKDPQTKPEKIIKHENLRGSSAYAGGGINA